MVAIVVVAVASVVAAMIAAVFAPMIAPVFVTTAFPVTTLPFLMTRNVLTAVPVVTHKVDPLAAGVVMAAVLFPISGMARRHAQINRRATHIDPLDDSRLTIDYLWSREAADVELTVEAGMADVDRDANVGSEYRAGNGGCDDRHSS